MRNSDIIQVPRWILVDPQPGVGNHVAEEGQTWVCAACGKTSKDKYGFQKIDRGWDESCMMNSVLCAEGKQ